MPLIAGHVVSEAAKNASRFHDDGNSVTPNPKVFLMDNITDYVTGILDRYVLYGAAKNASDVHVFVTVII